jgi:class 3 adenylate cyclase/tetratricopeptide (TPR) repeat protein
VSACTSCGAENPEGFRFCGSCGVALVAAPGRRESRRVVTIVFCDVTGSTTLGERLDPESLRRVLARYFDAMNDTIERHAGTVEKFIGDAVMAVFGIPTLHEDDAIRALRAAVEMRAALVPLNAELERDFGTSLSVRIGVNTGEVVTGTEERLATGDAVNVAARLEQAAQPSEILIGAETFRLARGVAEAEEVAPLSLKGKSETVAAYRLVSVAAESPARRLDIPIVGRTREQRLLFDAWEHALSDRMCVLFTLLGPAGIGKSRLAAEFLDGADATVVRARCLSYGEGITYWPVVELVVQLLGDDPSGRLAQLGLAEPAVAAIESLLGEGDAPTSPEQVAWAVRKLLEAVAAESPLVVVLDDLHWAEPTLLELVGHIAELSRGAPILLFCIARPELLDRMPSWGGGMLNATTVLLEPLSDRETDELLARLLGEARLGEDLLARIRQAAEGNPLFVEEMVQMVRDSDDGEISVPPTIHALLAARLDQLDPGDRGVLERGSVEGKVFHRGAVLALAPGEAHVDACLTALVRKELVRPEPATLPGEDAYKFRHLLIRDAAYDALPKAVRADLHERFARWLDERGADLVERDEIVGYHLEQAHRYHRELGPVGDAGRALALEAAERLGAGGRAALARRDARAAAGLLRRAADLAAGDASRLELLTDLADALWDGGELEEAGRLADEVVTGARARDDERLRARAFLLQLSMRAQTDPSRTGEDILGQAEATLGVLDRLGDQAGLGRAWAVVARMRFFLGQARSAEEAFDQSAAHARHAGDLRQEQESLEWRLAAKFHGSATVAETLAYIESLAEHQQRNVRLAALATGFRGCLEAMEGRFAEARALSARAAELAEDFGLQVRRGAHSQSAGTIELLAGDPAAAERELRHGYELLGALGETGFRSTTGSILAEALLLQGRDAEAESMLDELAAIMQADDVDPAVRALGVRGRLLARRGELAEARRLAEEAVALAEPTDYLDLRGEALTALAEVLHSCGLPLEEARALQAAVSIYEQKGNLVSAARARSLGARLGAAAG